MRCDEGVPDAHRRVECGTHVDYRQPLALVFERLLQDIPRGAGGRAALVSPTAKTLLPLLLRKLTTLCPLYLADPLHSNLEWQRAQVGSDQIVYLVGSATELPDSLTGLGTVFNPFGLQHWPAEAPHYASIVRKHSRGDAHLFTLDWGKTDYPEDIAGLPGIAEEVRFSQKAQLAPYGLETGWRQVSELEVAFGLQHTIEDIAVLLNPEHAVLLRAAAHHRPGSLVIVRSSIIYRHYEGVPQ
jgi:hypothetical protein